MTKITVKSTFTTIQGEGKVELGDWDVTSATVGSVKERIQSQVNIPVEQQSIWWRGYLIDEDHKTIMEACVGVNEGETIDAALDALLLFVTVPMEKPQKQITELSRLSAIDLLMMTREFSRSRQTMSDSCAIL